MGSIPLSPQLRINKDRLQFAMAAVVGAMVGALCRELGWKVAGIDLGFLVIFGAVGVLGLTELYKWARRRRA